MFTFGLIVCLTTATLITNVTGNMFSPFSSFPGFPSFSNFNPFGSSFGSPFTGSPGFPFGSSFGSSPFSSDETFAPSPPSPFPFQPPTPSFFRSLPATATPTGGPFGFPSFPAFPSFPSFTDFTKGLASGNLKGNGFKVTTTSTGPAVNGKPGQVIQTIKVEKIGTANGPGEERRFVQTISASGPLVSTSGSNSQKNVKGNNQINSNQRPVSSSKQFRLNNQSNNQQKNINQQRKPQLPFTGPTTTLVAPLTGLKMNGTKLTTSSKQSTNLNNSAGSKALINNPLLINSDNSGTGLTSSSNLSSSSSTKTTNGNTIGANKSTSSSSSQSIGSPSLKLNGADSSATSFSSVNNSDQSSVAKNVVTVKRVDSSGRIITGF